MDHSDKQVLDAETDSKSNNPSQDHASSVEAEGKSKNQLKNEAKRAEKLAKFQQKQAKLSAIQNTSVAKPKATNAKQDAATENGKLTLHDQDDESFVLGEKKLMDKPIADSYNPQKVESLWYAWWEKNKFFKPEYFGSVEEREKFSIIMPPPNVTGSLHLGHSLMVAVEDAVVRWQRMKGKAVLYLPGCDHAGIATQAVVEKKLLREKKITRHDLGREAFLKEVWDWKDQYGHRIYDQFKRLGTSVDWDRACFTLDPNANVAVNEAFVRMFEDGLITRASRLVHWSGKLKTAISDLELEMREIEPNTFLSAHGHDPKKKYEFGVLTSFAYKLAKDNSSTADNDIDDEIVISTTRPETVFADTAVAVNPKDQRYTRFHGKYLIHPVLGEQRRIPVILDELADPDFGTGALKISPAHDHSDFLVGKKHNLPFISIFDENNVLNENADSFAGMKRFDAREAVIEFTKKNGTFRGQTPHAMVLPICSRSGDIVEPRLIPQWWADCREMASKSVNAVKSKELTILPEEHERIWYHWLDNIKDWCISRQLWWGHRIPAYLVKFSDSITPSPNNTEQKEIWVAGRNYEEAMNKAIKLYPHVDPANIILEQDHDVLDTWFSSGLWPLTTMGWPNQTKDMDNFFPQSLLETGSDILFFWVARMVMMCIYLTGKIPFSQIFLHAIVRDAHGRKMSKSLGNVIDPIDVIEGISLESLQTRLDQGNLDPNEVKVAKEGQKRDFPNGIPQCGSDALRFGLCSYVAHGRDINMNITRIETYRRFCNKLWNACKFALLKLGSEYKPNSSFTLCGSESIADKWILSRLQVAIEETEQGFANYNLMNATGAVYNFWLYELCDVYIEVIKPICSVDYPDLNAQQSAKAVLYRCLEEGLRLLHPFMPFVTEELYQRLPRRQDDSIPSICISPFPIPSKEYSHPEAQAEFTRLNEMVKSIRSLASEHKCPKNSKIFLRPLKHEVGSLVRAQESAVASLVRAVGSLSILDSEVSSDPSQLCFNLEDHGISIEFVPPQSTGV